MHSLKGEKLHLKALKAYAAYVKVGFGEDSEQYAKTLQAIKEQQVVISRWQKNVSWGEEKECSPDYSGTLQSQIQARVEYEKKVIAQMPDWWENKVVKEERKDGSAPAPGTEF